jgi:hypothetical protein
MRIGLTFYLLIRGSLRREAITAIYRLVAARLERYLGILAARAARNIEHFACSAAAVCSARGAESSAAAFGGLARRAAIGATIGLVLKAFASEELLFSRAEDKFRTAIGAGQFFINIQSESPRCSGYGFDSLRTGLLFVCAARVFEP